jgi:hypothetical protein
MHQPIVRSTFQRRGRTTKPEHLAPWVLDIGLVESLRFGPPTGHTDRMWPSP